MFKIRDQITMWQNSIFTQEKFVLRCKKPFKIVAILKNNIYKLYGILKTLINKDLLKIQYIKATNRQNLSQ